MLFGPSGTAWGSESPGPSWGDKAVAMAHRTPNDVGPSFDFDIPAQPLNAALNQYADASGQPALFPSEIVGGRTSMPVKGRFSAEAALNMLLRDTGLVADKRDSGLGRTFILKKADAAPSAAADGMAALFGEQGYPGLVQTRVGQALCANARTRPGSYSALLRFRLEADGSVGGSRLVGSSGDARRDAALLDILRAVHIERPPPSALVERTVTLLIGAGSAAAGSPCGHEQESR